MDPQVSCSTAECGGKAVVIPLLLVYGPGGKGCVPTEFKMPLCGTCRGSIRIADLDSGEFRRLIGDLLRNMGHAQPDWSLTKLSFKLIENCGFHTLGEI